MSTTKPKRTSDVVIQDLGGEVLLYRAEDQAVHILNSTAQRIWELCDGEHTEEDMVQALKAGFTVPAEHDVAGDIRQTLECFADKGLLLDGCAN
ncbi:PqqD family protein [Candidatus Entotheonella palauensis]|uniref:PqqD family protein n=1 Tax=Candidatus Entotheonella palauensis TaxID=93172 RepID=UPI0015C41994|nr:PqqD family protein [Candidatus Entotheonella palauensis]